MFRLLFSLFLCLAAAEEWHVRGAPGQWVVQQGLTGPGAVASASFADSRSQDGWTTLTVKTLAGTNLSDVALVEGAGFLEGFITQKLILAAYVNYAGSATKNPLTEKEEALLESQMSFIHEQIKASRSEDPYWGAIEQILSHWDGMIAGFQKAAGPGSLSMSQLMSYILSYEIGDYARATAQSELVRIDEHGVRHIATPHPVFDTWAGKRMLLDEHCSVLIKRTDDDLISAHDTWSSMNTLLRVYKTYDFPSGAVQFSGYPGLPMSGDDWFITLNNKLVVTETTNGVFNTSLFSAMTSETIPYFIRVQVANMLATTGPEWHTIFSRYNNGGYNNQWMIVDYKLFDKQKTLPANTLVVGEQLPGYYKFEDQTQHLNDNQYWASYNIPFYKEVYDLAGYPQMYAKFGNEWSHDECARAKIYRRDQAGVSDVASMQKIQRYNRWQTDNLSLGDACRGISARCDLNNPWTKGCLANATLNGYAAFGAIDGKLTNSELISKMTAIAVCGPSWDNQAIFTWNAFPEILCEECPRTYAFDWREFSYAQ